MKTHHIAALFTFGLLLTFGWYLFFGATNLIETRKFLEVFLLGLGVGVSWMLTVLTDPSSNYIIQTRKEDKTIE